MCGMRRLFGNSSTSLWEKTHVRMQIDDDDDDDVGGGGVVLQCEPERRFVINGKTPRG